MAKQGAQSTDLTLCVVDAEVTVRIRKPYQAQNLGLEEIAASGLGGLDELIVRKLASHHRGCDSVVSAVARWQGR